MHGTAVKKSGYDRKQCLLPHFSILVMLSSCSAFILFLGSKMRLCCLQGKSIFEVYEPPISTSLVMANSLVLFFKLQHNYLLQPKPTVIIVPGSEGISKAVFLQLFFTFRYVFGRQSPTCSRLFHHICWYAFEPCTVFLV